MLRNLFPDASDIISLRVQMGPNSNTQIFVIVAATVLTICLDEPLSSHNISVS